jgi:hypothetical protein
LGFTLSANFDLVNSEYTEIVFCVVFASDKIVTARFFIRLSDKLLETATDETATRFDSLDH